MELNGLGGDPGQTPPSGGALIQLGGKMTQHRNVNTEDLSHLPSVGSSVKCEKVLLWFFVRRDVYPVH